MRTSRPTADKNTLAIETDARGKSPFDIDEVVKRIDKAVKPFAKAAMFELAERGHDSVFEQVAACIISVRTRDEATVPIALRLFEAANTPAQMVKLSWHQIDKLITPSTFHEPKAENILKIAQRAVDEFDGVLPCDESILLSLPGVGPKCAHLVLGVAGGQKFISVDIHVHRVTNRWGYVQTKTPEQTMVQLEGKLPKKYWIEINRLLVPFGKHICTGSLPKCSTCPVLEFCRQVGVEQHR